MLNATRPSEPPRLTRLISARCVVPVCTPPIMDGALVVDGRGTLLAVGPRDALKQQWSALPEERATGALLPGLVNAHAHLELSALAGEVAGGEGLIPWVGKLMPKAATLDGSTRLAAAREAVASLVATGTAALGDVSNDLACVAALQGSGLSGIIFHELLGSREQRTGDALADAKRELDACLRREQWPTGFSYVPAPHAPYSVSPPLLRRIFAHARRIERATSVHVAEDEDELALLRDNTGRWPGLLARLGVPERERTSGLSPVAHLAEAGAFDGGSPPLLVHMVHASDEDRRIAREAHATAVLCPRSNLHLGGRLPDVPALVRDGVALALGTDSLASTPDLSLWGEIAVLSQAFPELSPRVWLEAATQNGAAALGLLLHGALAPGKRPGVLDVLRDLPDAASVDDWLVALCHLPTPTAGARHGAGARPSAGACKFLVPPT